MADDGNREILLNKMNERAYTLDNDYMCALFVQDLDDDLHIYLYYFILLFIALHRCRFIKWKSIQNSDYFGFRSGLIYDFFLMVCVINSYQFGVPFCNTWLVYRN